MNVLFRQMVLTKDMHRIREYIPVRYREGLVGIVAENTDTEELLGAVLLDDWTYSSVSVGIFIKNPFIIRHGFFHECFTYAFSVAGRDIMWAMVSHTNKKSLKLVRRLGFTHMHTLENYYMRGDDALVFRLLKDECRFIIPGVQEAA